MSSQGEERWRREYGQVSRVCMVAATRSIKKKEFAAQRPNWQRPMMGCLDAVAIPLYLLLSVWWQAVDEGGRGIRKREPGRRR